MIPRQQQLWQSCLGTWERAAKVVSAAKRSKEKDEGIHAVKKRSKLRLAPDIMVPKKDTTALRMCIDYTSLNKHCPKDHFPLPRIDQIVNSTTGCDRLSFLDAYSRYNQIKLKKEDQELTAFITPHGVYCYNVMSFRFKVRGPGESSQCS
ncbi:hypothetical protein QYE76_012841 [Lolium multiflorum]|uniref:Reverse transcriptase domain-containing protein n=1 Tax=Lolium multiflorum TaxID=4521 RepID=A0AAD8U1Q4_LOLMU|nr:hypothetical protein QYE76_012841 [Lolium multiflorum]